MDTIIGTPLRLAHLPIIMEVLRRTKILEVIDKAVREDVRSKVSTSECVAVMLCSIFSGGHDLWRVRERLSRYDMATIMSDSGFKIEEFPEERLAKCCDDLWRVDVDKLMTSLAIQAIDQFSLDISFFHFDTTSLSFFGAYEREDFGSMGTDMLPAPRVCYGYSKDHRPDLKQILFGSLVTADGGVPLAGRALDGNRSDNESAAEFFADVRKLVKDPRQVCCVADSKGWCSRVLQVIDDHQMRLLSRLPRSHGLHTQLMAIPWNPTGTMVIPGKGKEPDEVLSWMAFDRRDTFVRTVAPEKPGDQPTTRPNPIEVHALRVRSTALLRTKMATAQRQREKEKKKAERLIVRVQAEAYACERDAIHAATLAQEHHQFTCWDLKFTAIRHAGAFRVGRGRPRKHPRPEITGDHHYRLAVAMTAVPEKDLAVRLQDAASYILIRTRNAGWDITDVDMIKRYKGQYHNEHGFSWLKSGMRLNPIFLKTPHRIGSLCFIYCIGLMIWTLIQRTVRKHLKDHQIGLPYHRGKESDHITTRFYFELFQQLQVIPLTNSEGKVTKHLAGFDAIIEKACTALGCKRTIFEPK